MTDPWAEVAPAAVTSVVTTLLTLGVTAGVGGIRRRIRSAEQPLLLRRSVEGSWRVKNVGRRTLAHLDMTAWNHEGEHLEDEDSYGWGPPRAAILEPGAELYVGKAPVGSVGFSWFTLRRNRPHRYWSAQVRIRDGEDEYQPVAERVPNNGGAGR